MFACLFLIASLGLIGQSQSDACGPLDFLSATVVGGRDGVAYVNGAWKIPAGSMDPVRLVKSLKCRLVSDGAQIYAWHPENDELRLVREVPDGLVEERIVARLPHVEWSPHFAIAPAGCTKGYAARVRFAVLDRKNHRVVGLDANGSEMGVLVDYSTLKKAKDVEAVGFWIETGDILLGTGYPERQTHRFAKDGREIVDAAWPKGSEAADYAVANGRTWAVSCTLKEISSDAARRQAIGDGTLYRYHSLAWTGAGYWVGTVRGVEYYDAKDLTKCRKRLGGVGDVTTLALMDGRVFATVGSRICMYYLDDLPDEPMSSDDFQLWHLGGYRAGTVTGVTKRDGKLIYGFQPKNGPIETWQFDYRITDWTHRGDRLRKLDEPPPKMDPSAAKEGHWIVCYDKLRQALCRLRDENSVVSSVRGYNSWPMIQAMGDRLVCSYSRDKALPADGHTIGSGSRDVYARVSRDGGCTWSDEVTVAADPTVGEVNEGIGLDSGGAVLAWVRCWSENARRHELYRSTDGVRFAKLCSLTPDPMPMQITDPVAVPELGLASPWFAGDYRNNDRHSWGLLVSRDDGKSWEQRTIESGLSKQDWVTEPSLVSLGKGRLLIVGRCEGGGGNQFQVTSRDGGKTWRKARTNIGDVCESTPSLVYDARTDLVANYYYHRGARQLKRRVVKASFIFDHPAEWPLPDVLAVGCEPRDWDAGNVNVTRLKGGVDCCAWYTGSSSNATVLVTLVRAHL